MNLGSHLRFNLVPQGCSIFRLLMAHQEQSLRRRPVHANKNRASPPVDCARCLSADCAPCRNGRVNKARGRRPRRPDASCSFSLFVRHSTVSALGVLRCNDRGRPVKAPRRVDVALVVVVGIFSLAWRLRSRSAAVARTNEASVAAYESEEVTGWGQ